jgi:uncharacterized protein DUF5677
VAFLAVNGYGAGASKILRGLYERALALAYMIQFPDKAERFVRFAAIQEHRGLEAALKITTEKEFDEAVFGVTTAAQIREFYRQVKPEFQTTVCKKCGTTRTQGTWDLDVAAMAFKVGNPYDKYYLGAYINPNFPIHATLASVFHGDPEQVRMNRSEKDAEVALLLASCLFVLVIRSQNTLFTLNLDTEIDACEGDMGNVWAVASRP